MSDTEDNLAFERVTRIVRAPIEVIASVGSGILAVAKAIDNYAADRPDELKVTDDPIMNRGYVHDYLPDVDVIARARNTSGRNL
jgi:hypothetical protein